MHTLRYAFKDTSMTPLHNLRCSPSTFILLLFSLRSQGQRQTKMFRMEMRMRRWLKPSLQIDIIGINLILVILLSLTSGILLDIGIAFSITYHYREIEPYASLDAPTFQEWKEPMHYCILISAWLLLSCVIILWRYVQGLLSLE